MDVLSRQMEEIYVSKKSHQQRKIKFYLESFSKFFILEK